MSMIFGVRNLAKEFGVKPVTIYRWINNGMPYHQISEKKRAFDLDEIKEWVKSKDRNNIQKI